MTWGGKTRAVLFGATACTLAWGAVPASAGVHAAAKAKSAKLAELGHGVFWECPAKTTEILIGVNNLDLHPGQRLNVNFIVKNLGSTAFSIEQLLASSEKRVGCGRD